MNSWFNRKHALEEELGDQAGLDSRTDRYRVGYITAIKDFLNMSYDDTQETE